MKILCDNGVEIETSTNPELTDELLQQYANGKFSEDVKWRGQELAQELLRTRLRLRGFLAKHGLPLEEPR